MPENRLEPVTVANKLTNEQLAPVSPTGTPMLSPKLVPWLTILVVIAAALPLVPGMPVAVAAVCGVVTAIGTVLGIVSPGLRTKP